MGSNKTFGSRFAHCLHQVPTDFKLMSSFHFGCFQVQRLLSSPSELDNYALAAFVTKFVGLGREEELELYITSSASFSAFLLCICRFGFFVLSCCMDF